MLLVVVFFVVMVGRSDSSKNICDRTVSAHQQPLVPVITKQQRSEFVIVIKTKIVIVVIVSAVIVITTIIVIVSVAQQ